MRYQLTNKAIKNSLDAIAARDRGLEEVMWETATVSAVKATDKPIAPPPPTHIALTIENEKL